VSRTILERRCILRIVAHVVVLASLAASAQIIQRQSNIPEIKAGQQAIADLHFLEARRIFTAYLDHHPDNLDARMGAADADLGLHNFEAAELGYRRVVAQQPQMWLAHKNLVLVEAELGRWDEFDRERAILRGARDRNEPGITARESDVIDSFTLHNQHWIVREYYEPVGRSLTRYNFERFSTAGRAEEYISLESASAAAAILANPTAAPATPPVSPAAIKDFALNFYTGTAHGTIAHYPNGEPTYERVRKDVMHWLATHPPAASAR
jgi:hypothetical protein